MTHNFYASDVKGISTGAQVTLQPRVPAQPNTITRTFEALPQSLNFPGQHENQGANEHVGARSDSFETIKHLFPKVSVGFHSGLADGDCTHTVVTPKMILSSPS